MSEMVERVARLICREMGENPDGSRLAEHGLRLAEKTMPIWRRYEPIARAVIAEMRSIEPMYNDLSPSVTECYQAMIDAALGNRTRRE